MLPGVFETFSAKLDAAGVFANEGKMVDASFVEVPRQRNNREKNTHIKKQAQPRKPGKISPTNYLKKILMQDG